VLRRSQYSLRTLCLVTFCCALLFGVTVRFGLVSGVTLGAMAGLVWSLNDDPHRWARLVAFGLFVLGVVFAVLVLVWIAGALGFGWLLASSQ
jgi:hypothetical protein